MRLAWCAIFVLLAGCAGTRANDPLSPAKFSTDDITISAGGYRLAGLRDNANTPDLLVLLCFSGGGKRSSAFGYGVLRGLRDFTFPWNGETKRLIDAISAISSVSGGSFPAAYYGLYRDRIFTDFEKDFLKRDIDAYIWGTYFLPWNYRWLLDPNYGTNDRMAGIYDDLMFHGATYADLIKQGRPMIAINATDVDHGLVFPFDQNQFDLICSDLTNYPVARAVAASNGFPILFTPITLKSYRAHCGTRAPAWIAKDAAGDPLSRISDVADSEQKYLDPDATQYVHLMDGGIADNLAMRSMINTMVALNDNRGVVGPFDLSPVRRILLISSDGQAANDASSARKPGLSSLGQIAKAVSGTQIDSYNFETFMLGKSELDSLRDTIRKMRCAKGPMVNGHPCGDVESYFVHLSLAGVPDPAERHKLQAIPTGLTISAGDVKSLIEAGENQVAASPELVRFRASLATIPDGGR